MTNLSGVIWRKSRRSQDNGACVEVANLGATIGLRDSKDPAGPVLVFTRDEFVAFIHCVASGEIVDVT
ncbi:MAG TPA: DUF397 domain-containing protein [Micromonosporaceae bacterium]|nr:DUF397 domain-containing protein [Micromonosporaceae bacterium]